MTTSSKANDTSPPPSVDPGVLEKARREKLARFREQYNVTGYGQRVADIQSLAEARALFDQSAHEQHQANQVMLKENPDAEVGPDTRQRALVAGRCVQHRAMGKLVFIVLRDYSGDLQISISKAAVDQQSFKIASKLDYGDIVVAEGPVGMTNKGEICIWAERFELHSKSLAPPPEKFHGLSDAELRYRQRYVDMYANPETIETFQQRSKIVSSIRRFMDDRDFLEVETPMMQAMAGGAAARPFTTHHNALDMPLYMRIAPELYLKKLLVGGLPRIYEINRNFRNEGVDRQHNPEFTSMEVYEAFGNYESMLELTESLIYALAKELSHDCKLPFGDLLINYNRPFRKVRYAALFEETVGFAMTEFDRVREKARALNIANEAKLDDWLVVNEVFEKVVEPMIDPQYPTFVLDYPSVISPLTRPRADDPNIAERWDLFIGGMEIGPAYTELNDPDIQLKKFTEQLKGADDEETTFRSMDEDFINALKVGMPPAGGLGLGIDRLVMLLTNSTTIRDVILFPLLRPE